MAERIAQLVGQLRSRTEQLEAVLGCMVQGVCAVDAEGRFFMCNRAFEEIFGCHPVGRMLDELSLPSEFSSSLRKALGGESFSCELCVGERVFWGTFSPLGEGGAIAVLQDITPQKELERAKREFVMNASHELRTPLTAIKGYLELIEDEMGDQQRDYLEVVKRHIDRLTSIVEDLITLAKLEEPSFKPERRRVDLGEIVKGVCRLFEERARQKGIELVCEGDGEIVGDPFLVEQVVMNLVDNALKYTHEGSVKVQARREGDWVVLEVRDTGVGIPKEHLSRIFERFYVVDKSRSRRLGGTGLGLSIVKHAVELLGGRIEVESTPGFGSTFRVWFSALTEN